LNTKLIVPACLVLLLLILLIWLLFKTKTRSVTVPCGAQAGQIFLAPCTVKLNGKNYQADCGTLVVPEKRVNPAARLIALPVIRIRSSASEPAKPIFYLGGGPGISNMGFKPPARLLAEHDIVLVGYRGVDGTPKLDCPEIAKAVTGVGGDLLSPASLNGMGAAMQVCAARLQSQGMDLAGYTIPEVAEDMESARAALGYQRIDLLSESYGTRVAQFYADMHPASLLRSAMIGVNPPGHFYWDPVVVDAQVAYYAALWKKSDGAAAPDLVETMRSVNQNMPRRWLFLPIDPGKVKIIAFSMLYYRSTAPIIFDAYISAAHGDPSGLALMSAAYDFMMPNMMTWGEFFAKGASADYHPGQDYRAALTTPGAVLGSPMALLVWGSVGSNWPANTIPAKYRLVQPTNVETLLISGSIDFSTPAQFAEQELLPALRNGQQVIIAEQGHVNDFWDFQPEARQRLLTSFYNTGKADASLYQILPMNFKPAMRFPTLAKVLLVVSILLVFGIAWGAWSMMRRFSKRQANLAR
jgi:pimeloyl-ACP methyl ester carboxylesterase